MIRLQDKTRNILSLMKSNNLNNEQLKVKLGLGDKDFNSLLKGELKIEELLAYKLSYYLKTTPKYWLTKYEYK